MANTVKAVPTDERWGKESEAQLGAENEQSWKKEAFVDTIPWDYSRFRELLEKYSKVPPDQVIAKIFEIREKAWQIAKYPCIGYFTYLKLLEFDGTNPGMQRALERLKAPGSQETFLEIGGFMCQTIRQLVFEGVDSARLYGTDLHSEFLELGYEQFQDRETLKATFVAGDLLVSDAEWATSEMAKAFDGKMTIAHAANFFHLFSWDSQLIICERIVGFFRRGLSAENPAVLFGNHLGSIKPGDVRVGGFRVFMHDQTTFQSLWDEVGKKTGTTWKAHMEPVALAPPKPNVFSDDARVMRYSVSRVD
ncbi:hypothetical protein F5Y07DRAFT_145424 [Xylaria sp. FL0933]|nr:hypothetical protein F5Y07DRAFT_145424 [Xylaria sp. FL0933]